MRDCWLCGTQRCIFGGIAGAEASGVPGIRFRWDGYDTERLYRSPPERREAGGAGGGPEIEPDAGQCRYRAHTLGDARWCNGGKRSSSYGLPGRDSGNSQRDRGELPGDQVNAYRAGTCLPFAD